MKSLAFNKAVNKSLGLDRDSGLQKFCAHCGNLMGVTGERCNKTLILKPICGNCGGREVRI